MTMPASGQVSLSQANVELDYTATAQISMNDANVRSLGDKASGAIAFSDFYNRFYTFYGQQAFTSPGLHTWVCPDEVTSISTVCVGGGGYGAGSSGGGPGGGGGGLGYKNNISVTPGTTYYVYVGHGGNREYFTYPANDGTGSQFIISDTAPVRLHGTLSNITIRQISGYTEAWFLTNSDHTFEVGDTVVIECTYKPCCGEFEVISAVSARAFRVKLIYPVSRIQKAPNDDLQYTIETTGTTDFTQFGAANSNPGTTFSATADGNSVADPGTGTVKITALSSIADDTSITATYYVSYVWKGTTLVRGGGGDSGDNNVNYGGDYSPSRTCMGGVYIGDGGGYGADRRSTDASTAGSGGGAAGYDGNGGSNSGGAGGNGSGSGDRGGGGGGVGIYGEGRSGANPPAAYRGGGMGGSSNIVEANFSGTTMTVTSVTSVGNLKVGSYIFDDSVATDYNNSANRTVAGSGGAIPLGTYITALGTGTGGVGTYTISTSVTASSVSVGSFADGIGGWRGGTHDSTGTTKITGLTANEYASVSSAGDSDWTLIGALDSVRGAGFVATGAGTGTGVAFNGGFGNSYGGGGGGHDSSSAGQGSQGGVRLIYGQGRVFPATLTTDQPEGFNFGTAT